MAETKINAGQLTGLRVLIVEDEYFLADDLRKVLEAAGATVVGPFADLSDAQDQIAGDGFDVAVINIKLHEELAYSLADDLTRRHIPFVFMTGYGGNVIPNRFKNVTRWNKPFLSSQIAVDICRLCGR